MKSSTKTKKAKTRLNLPGSIPTEATLFSDVSNGGKLFMIMPGGLRRAFSLFRSEILPILCISIGLERVLTETSAFAQANSQRPAEERLTKGILPENLMTARL